MTSRWKKVWADFWGNKSRMVLTIMIIAVSTFAVGADNNLRLYMTERLQSDYLSAKTSEATVYASPLDDEMVKIARAVPGVDAVEGRSLVVASVIPPKGKPAAALFTAVEDPNDLTLNILAAARRQGADPGGRHLQKNSGARTGSRAPSDGWADSRGPRFPR